MDGVAKSQAEYFKSLGATGVITFLMDEPDRSLSIDNQVCFWKDIAVGLAKRHQVVIATHSPFAFMRKEANWIDFQAEYRETCLSSLKDYFKEMT